jgi:diamine N-acetyltransferase
LVGHSSIGSTTDRNSGNFLFAQHSAETFQNTRLFESSYTNRAMDMNALRYRAAAPGDVDVLLRLMRDLQRDDPWSVQFHEDKVRASVLELLQSPSMGRAFLICDGELCIGYLVLSFDFSLEFGGKNAWIDELFVRPEFRRQGVGSRALDFAAQTARELGAKVLHLEVNRGNPAIHLYERCGFEEHDRYLLSKWLEGRQHRNP